jgi:hypothetical protein
MTNSRWLVRRGSERGRDCGLCENPRIPSTTLRLVQRDAGS